MKSRPTQTLILSVFLRIRRGRSQELEELQNRADVMREPDEISVKNSRATACPGLRAFGRAPGSHGDDDNENVASFVREEMYGFFPFFGFAVAYKYLISSSLRQRFREIGFRLWRWSAEDRSIFENSQK